MTGRAQAVWLAAWVGVVAAPALLWVATGGREYTSVWGRLVTLTGMVAAGLLVFTLAVGTRLRHRGYGVPVHRYAGESTAVAVAAHMLCVLAVNPDNAWLFVIPDAPPNGAAGTGAALCLMAVMGLGVWRKQSGMPPGRWRAAHVTVAWLAGLLALAHVVWIGQLVYVPVWAGYLAALAVGAVVMVGTRPRGR